jgi:hypothetical protein
MSKQYGNPWEPALANAGRIVAAAAGPVLACISLFGGLPWLAIWAGVAGIIGGVVVALSPIE